MPHVLSSLEKLTQDDSLLCSWENTAIVLRNDLEVRKLEGLEFQKPALIKEWEGLDLSKIEIQVGEMTLSTNLLTGQKTGFFLDQSQNLKTLAQLLESKESFANAQGPIRILDLCSYVGQWSVQAAISLQKKKIQTFHTLVDTSQAALDFAKENLMRAGVAESSIELIKSDVLSENLVNQLKLSYSVIFCDPPALIQNRKTIPQGTHAYTKLNALALNVLEVDGIIVSSSCSSYMNEITFTEMLARAESRSRSHVQWFERGSQAPDHPTLSAFPEGKYLKTFFGRKIS
jgi:23S rRNA (cytosine1962-C5)-methyltransferase